MAYEENVQPSKSAYYAVRYKENSLKVLHYVN